MHDANGPASWRAYHYSYMVSISIAMLSCTILQYIACYMFIIIISSSSTSSSSSSSSKNNTIIITNNTIGSTLII